MNLTVPKRRYVKPGAAVKVRDPQTGQHVPDEGAWLLDTNYLRRRLKSGDLVETNPPKPVKPAKAAAGEES